jgi:hypothetical protein
MDDAWAKGLNVVAVLDPASLPSAWSKFGDLAQSRGGGSLFSGTQYAQDTAVAPLFLPLQRPDVATQTALVKLALAAPAVIWLASDLEVAPLMKVLTAKLHAELADPLQQITLRYYDPRVLPALLQILDSDQRNHLNGGVRVWWWLDHLNALHSEPISSTQPVMSTIPFRPAAIALSEHQVQALLNESFVDRVLDVLSRTMPDGLQLLDRAPRYALAERSVHDAGAFGLTAEYDCASYMAVALQHGHAFAEQPDWAPLMADVKCGTSTFSDAIATWEEVHAETP